ncbi:hypothetical protein AGJ34_20790 [Cronobacter dublinensis subsp. dublinensis]|nr:hypothetical protein [Cronobacter dublinensis subsp. dublinensis]EGT5729713.1 hypothetical protein [Cronobacter dublinensis subsp. dublinensis]
MIHDLLENITFGFIMVCTIIAWVAGVLVLVSGLRGRNDFIDWMPESVLYTVFAEWTFLVSLPLLNHIADEKQFGSAVGAAREFAMFSERPWYGTGGGQFLIFILIAIAGAGCAWYKRNRY